MDDFELYLAKRKKTGKRLLIGAAVFLVASIVVPFALMKGGVIKRDTFEIFVVVDVLLGAAAVRAGLMRLKDSGNLPGPMPFS